jgi:hypothetical protein
MNSNRFSCFLCILLGWASLVRGDLVISVENETGIRGTTAFVGVYAYTTASDQLQGFNLPIDVGNDGNGLISGLTFNATPIQNVNPGLTFLGFNTAENTLVNQNNGGIDGIVNADSVSLSGLALSTSPTTPTKLFDIALDISPTLIPPGGVTVPISIITDTFPLANVYSVTTNPPTNTSVTQGSLVISAVPESASLINSVGYLLVASLMGLGYFRWRYA